MKQFYAVFHFKMFKRVHILLLLFTLIFLLSYFGLEFSLQYKGHLILYLIVYKRVEDI